MVMISRVISNVKTKKRLHPCSLALQVTRSSRVGFYLHLWVFIIVVIIFTATFLLLLPSQIFSHQYFPQFLACPSLLSVIGHFFADDCDEAAALHPADSSSSPCFILAASPSTDQLTNSDHAAAAVCAYVSVCVSMCFLVT